jgi:hypothetical protein
MKMAWILVVGLLVAGCKTTQRSYVRDTLARLPSGDEISEEAESVQRFGGTSSSSSMLVWRRKSSTERLLAVEGKGEWRVKDAGKVLEAKGDAKEWYKTRQNTPPTVHVSANGNRAWLVAQGQVVASFDYDSGVAIFGGSGQPAWATVGQ